MTKIARYIDDPPSIFFWEIDEVAIFSTLLTVGIFFHLLTLMLVISTVITLVLQKVKATKSEGYFMHWLYWQGLYRLRGCVPSYYRTFIE